GQPISATAVRKLACHGEIIAAVLDADGQPLDVARAHRLVTPGIWLALIARDRHCAFPGCRRPPIACDAHHIKHWANGGPTALRNMLLLCRAHHTIIHTTGWEVRINPTDGRPEFKPPPLGRRLRHALRERVTGDDWIRERTPRE
ncbi:MAG: HNH endonuclease signature motif containing protein, partial [Nocardioides sp.]